MRNEYDLLLLLMCFFFSVAMMHQTRKRSLNHTLCDWHFVCEWYDCGSMVLCILNVVVVVVDFPFFLSMVFFCVCVCCGWSVTVFTAWFTMLIHLMASYLFQAMCTKISPQIDSTYWLKSKHDDDQEKWAAQEVEWIYVYTYTYKEWYTLKAKQTRSEQESGKRQLNIQSPLPDNRFKSIVLWTTSTRKKNYIKKHVPILEMLYKHTFTWKWWVCVCLCASEWVCIWRANTHCTHIV